MIDKIYQYKNINFAREETTTLMEPYHSNIYGNVHGGELMRLVDTVGGMAATKHCRGKVVTARIDEIIFLKPVEVGSIVRCIGQLAYVGNSSMQVLVSIYSSNIKNYDEPELALTAFVTMVHIIDNRPAKVPELIVNTEEERIVYELGKSKYMEIKGKKNKNI